MRIHIASNAGVYPTVPRRLGKVNLGLWCDICHEFFAVAVVENPAATGPIEITSDGPVRFQCPFCAAPQSREPSEMIELKLTESLKHRPPRPSGSH